MTLDDEDITQVMLCLYEEFTGGVSLILGIALHIFTSRMHFHRNLSRPTRGSGSPAQVCSLHTSLNKPTRSSSTSKLSTSKMAMSEQSVFACFEIARFAFFILPSSPGEDEPSLRAIGINLALELKVRIVLLKLNSGYRRLTLDANTKFE